MKAMILAAGLGTRLGSVGMQTPKVLLEIGGRPLLARHLQQLERAGIGHVVINTHHLADQIAAFVRAYDGPLEVRCLHEDRLLGTAGAVRNALPLLGAGPILVLYGDVLVDEPLQPMIELHRERRAVATLAVHAAESAEGKGTVVLDERGRVTRFEEKRRQRAGRALINSGAYVVQRELVALLEPDVASDFGHDLFPTALARGLPLYGYELASPAIDIGTHEGLRLARSLASRGATAA